MSKRKFLDTDIGEITILSRDEKKQESMRLKYNNPKLRFVLGDIRSYDTLKQYFKGIDYIFHAAALKRVDTAEYNPLEFIKTNIIGAQNIIQACMQNEVENVIALSTDKACSPINLYGASKLLSDKLFISGNDIKGKSRTKCYECRLGCI